MEQHVKMDFIYLNIHVLNVLLLVNYVQMQQMPNNV